MKNIVNKILKDREISIYIAAKEIGIAYGTLRKYMETDSMPRALVLEKISRWVNKYNTPLEAITFPRKDRKNVSHTIDGSVSGITLSFSKDRMEINIQFK